MIHTAIYDHLAADAGVSALVLSRIYRSGNVPKSPLFPYLVYQQLSGPHEHHQGGGSGLTAPRFQITCWSRSSSSAHTLAKAVREAMDSFRGSLGTSPNQVTVRALTIENELDGFETETSAGVPSEFSVIQDYQVWHVVSTT
ncbi:MAG: DUF3168 domain-containing protein [Methyloligellaceae bacterium]